MSVWPQDGTGNIWWLTAVEKLIRHDGLLILLWLKVTWSVHAGGWLMLHLLNPLVHRLGLVPPLPQFVDRSIRGQRRQARALRNPGLLV